MQAPQPSSPIGPREQALNAHIQKYQALLDRPGTIEEKSQAMADAIFDTTCLLFLNVKPDDLGAYTFIHPDTFKSTDKSTEEYLKSPVRQFIKASNMLRDYIKTSTLIRDESSKEQPNIENVKMWLAVADELRKKNDFNSLQNVVSGLARSVKLCGDALDPEERRKYNEYSDLFIGEKDPFERVRPRVINAANNGEIVIPQLSMFTSEQEKIKTEKAQLDRQIDAGLKNRLANEKQANINSKGIEFMQLFNKIQFNLPKVRSPSVEERSSRLAQAEKQFALEASRNARQEGRAPSLASSIPLSPMAAQASTASMPAVERRDSMESKSFISRFQKSVSRRLSFGGAEQEKLSVRKGSDPSKMDETAEKAGSVFTHPETSEEIKKAGADTLGRLVNEVTKLIHLKQVLEESTNKKDTNTLGQISQLSMGIASTNAKIEGMRAKIVVDSIERKKQQNPNIMTEKGGELFNLYSDLITHLSTQKKELEKVIESFRQNMKDNKRPSSVNESAVMELQSLQTQVDRLNKQLHDVELNKIRLSDPKSLPDEYEESLFQKSISLFAELDQIRKMPANSLAQIQAQKNSLHAFSEKLNMHHEMVNIFVENAGSNFTKLSEKRTFRTTFEGPIDDLIKEKATLNDQIETNFIALQQGKNAGKDRSFTQSP